MIQTATAAARRGAVLSALYLLAYLTMGSAALAVGRFATRCGLGVAADIAAALIVALSAAVAALLLASHHRGVRPTRTEGRP